MEADCCTNSRILSWATTAGRGSLFFNAGTDFLGNFGEAAVLCDLQEQRTVRGGGANLLRGTCRFGDSRWNLVQPRRIVPRVKPSSTIRVLPLHVFDSLRLRAEYSESGRDLLGGIAWTSQRVANPWQHAKPRPATGAAVRCGVEREQIVCSAKSSMTSMIFPMSSAR